MFWSQKLYKVFQLSRKSSHFPWLDSKSLCLGKKIIWEKYCFPISYEFHHIFPSHHKRVGLDYTPSTTTFQQSTHEGIPAPRYTSNCHSTHCITECWKNETTHKTPNRAEQAVTTLKYLFLFTPHIIIQRKRYTGINNSRKRWWKLSSASDWCNISTTRFRTNVNEYAGILEWWIW